jgi:hypothetical protein
MIIVPHRRKHFRGGGLGPDDVFYLRSDSTDESTDFTGLDLGPNSYSITRNGSGVVHDADTAISGYGATSIYHKNAIPGSLSTPAGGSDFVVPANTDFTIEMWVEINSSSNILLGEIGKGPNIAIYALAGPLIHLYNNGGFVWLSYDISGVASAGTPFHLCFDRFGTGADNLGLFVDGVQQDTVSNNTAFGTSHATEGFAVNGALNGTGTSNYECTLDGIRFSNGTSLYQNSNFTAPTTPPI